ncbi:Transcriptional regulatory protein fixJ [Serratia fonticola]|uniref:Transcriptional regulatory protein fixJ n=1 Tax=Serratia fonticola TaxID=47917 RepID=A0A4U9U7K0_SERFO|nr:Transcriptional regulatory protein fixJ [Serratia fonticola]
MQQRFSTLTSRERDIASAVAAGMTNKAIADRYFVAVRTVEVHRSKVMEKMQATSLAELVSSLNLLAHRSKKNAGQRKLTGIWFRRCVAYSAHTGQSRQDRRLIGALFLHFLLQHVFAFHTQFQRQRRGDVDRRYGTDRHTDQHGQ